MIVIVVQGHTHDQTILERAIRSETPQEIAVSIVAELISVRAGEVK